MLCHDSKVVLRTPRGYDTEAVTRDILQKNVLKNSAKYRGRHSCGSHFYNKICLQPINLLENKLWIRGFPMNFLNF